MSRLANVTRRLKVAAASEIVLGGMHSPGGEKKSKKMKPASVGRLVQDVSGWLVAVVWWWRRGGSFALLYLAESRK